MGVCGAVDSTGQVGRQQAPHRCARSDERDHVCLEHGMPVAGDPERPASAQHTVRLSRFVELGRHAGPHPSRALCGMPGARWTGSQSDRRHHRQPKREERRKRGACIDPHGYDAGKKIKGKKRHILVDTLGLLLHAIVHPADIQDREGGIMLLATMFGLHPFLKKLFADAAYQGPQFRREGMGRMTASTAQELVSCRIEPSRLKKARWQLTLDQLFRSDELEACIHAVQRTPGDGKPQTSEFTTIRFIRANKLSRANRITAGFEALVLSKSLSRPIGVAKIIHGDDSTEIKIRGGTVLRELTKAIGHIRKLLAAASPPDLVLNRHCPECQFRDQCRKKAIEKDDLSLLAGLTDNERTRLNGRGIFTVNQLSYTFRPRRRAKRLAGTPEKYHHSLKALALREQKIHFIGSPQLRIDGTPVFFDVESLPDRDFYYLVGIRLEHQKECPEIHSLWANSRSDERRNWSDFLAILTTIEKPILVHYGSFETKIGR